MHSFGEREKKKREHICRVDTEEDEQALRAEAL